MFSLGDFFSYGKILLVCFLYIVFSIKLILLNTGVFLDFFYKKDVGLKIQCNEKFAYILFCVTYFIMVSLLAINSSSGLIDYENTQQYYSLIRHTINFICILQTIVVFKKYNDSLVFSRQCDEDSDGKTHKKLFVFLSLITITTATAIIITYLLLVYQSLYTKQKNPFNFSKDIFLGYVLLFYPFIYISTFLQINKKLPEYERVNNEKYINHFRLTLLFFIFYNLIYLINGWYSDIIYSEEYVRENIISKHIIITSLKSVDIISLLYISLTSIHIIDHFIIEVYMDPSCSQSQKNLSKMISFELDFNFEQYKEINDKYIKWKKRNSSGLDNEMYRKRFLSDLFLIKDETIMRCYYIDPVNIGMPFDTNYYRFLLRKNIREKGFLGFFLIFLKTLFMKLFLSKKEDYTKIEKESEMTEMSKNELTIDIESLY